MKKIIIPLLLLASSIYAATPRKTKRITFKNKTPYAFTASFFRKNKGALVQAEGRHDGYTVAPSDKEGEVKKTKICVPKFYWWEKKWFGVIVSNGETKQGQSKPTPALMQGFTTDLELSSPLSKTEMTTIKVAFEGDSKEKTITLQVQNGKVTAVVEEE